MAIDFESYGAAQFRFDPAQGRTFAEATQLARRRGAQFVQAVAQEYPDAVLLALWLNSIHFKAGRSTQPESILVSSAYGLLPAFIDGMLDALPPDMILVDGCEHGYYMDSAEAYLQAANEMRSWHGACARLVSPENRAKYRQQVQAGFGFYLDMYLNPEGNRYYFPPLDGSRLARLERNLGFARDAADEYVWIYGEQCRWWGPRRELPNTAGQGRLWEEAMPGHHSSHCLHTRSAGGCQGRTGRASRVWPTDESGQEPGLPRASKSSSQDRCQQNSELGRMRRRRRGNSPGTRRSAKAPDVLRK